MFSSSRLSLFPSHSAADILKARRMPRTLMPATVPRQQVAYIGCRGSASTVDSSKHDGKQACPSADSVRVRRLCTPQGGKRLVPRRLWQSNRPPPTTTLVPFCAIHRRPPYHPHLFHLQTATDTRPCAAADNCAVTPVPRHCSPHTPFPARTHGRLQSEKPANLPRARPSHPRDQRFSTLLPTDDKRCAINDSESDSERAARSRATKPLQTTARCPTIQLSPTA